MAFHCNICGSRQFDATETRGDGKRVFFCGTCRMGVIEDPPESTEAFYMDGYYSGSPQGHGYADYHVTAEHSQLWVRLMTEAVCPDQGRVLDIGCADGFALSRLKIGYELFGIEANDVAAKQAEEKGITVLSHDLFTAFDENPAPFDVITSIATFEHVLDFKKAFEVSLNSLAQNGVLIFEVPLISATQDNRDWINGSYEHIFYPTVSGMDYLLCRLPANCFGFESIIRGFSSSYIGFATRKRSTFDTVKALFLAMQHQTLADLSLSERRLNLAYHVVHGFQPNPERVLALPDLLEVAATPELMRHFCRLWYPDSLEAAQRAYLEQQVKNWREAYVSAVATVDTSLAKTEMPGSWRSRAAKMVGW